VNLITSSPTSASTVLYFNFIYPVQVLEIFATGSGFGFLCNINSDEASGYFCIFWSHPYICSSDTVLSSTTIMLMSWGINFVLHLFCARKCSNVLLSVRTWHSYPFMCFLYYCIIMSLFVFPYLWHGAYYFLIEAQKQHLTNYIISSQPISEADSNRVICTFSGYMTSACVVDIFVVKFCCMAEISSFYHLCQISWYIIYFVLSIYVFNMFSRFFCFNNHHSVSSVWLMRSHHHAMQLKN
jgi:hypothetical protein